MSKIISVTHSGELKTTYKFLQSLGKGQLFRAVLEHYGKRGVNALRAATPKDTGQTALSWSYDVDIREDKIVISWSNDRMGSDGKTPVAILIQQGHGTRRGAYVEGIDYINPALKPVFDDMAEAIWQKVVTS